jgi:hypothetical protein
LRAFGAEQGREEGEEGEQAHGEVLRAKDGRVQMWNARSAREGARWHGDKWVRRVDPLTSGPVGRMG